MLTAPEVCERVKEEIMCTHCTDRWKSANIKAAFAEVVWTSSIVAAPKMSPYELSFIEAFKTAALYGFMDGVMRLLAVRLLDVVIHGGLCDVHKKIMVSCPTSMGELGALSVQVLKDSQLVTLKGMPDLGVHTRDKRGTPNVILIVELRELLFT